MIVKESTRKVTFNTGKSITFTNVTNFNADGSWLRLECDQGYILLNPANILYMTIPIETKVV